MLKKIIFSALLAATMSTASAAETYKIFVGNPAGAATTDLIARKVGEIYHKNTGNTLQVVNVPGGHQIPVIVEFKKEKIALLSGTFTMHVYNYMTNDNLPYNDKDFKHLGFLGEQPAIYFTEAGSPIKTPKDLITVLPESGKPFIGTHATQPLLNIMSLRTYKDKRITPVHYRGPNDIIADAVAGRLPVGFAAVGGSNIRDLEKQGRVQFIGNTTAQDLTINGKKVPSVAKELGIMQFNGAAIMSMRAGDTPEHQKLAADITKILNDPEFRKWLMENWVVPVKTDKDATTFLNELRAEHIARKDWLDRK
jgi:tripartite-type tricarboxylate transporter receptor subunit TctC